MAFFDSERFEMAVIPALISPPSNVLVPESLKRVLVPIGIAEGRVTSVTGRPGGCLAPALRPAPANRWLLAARVHRNREPALPCSGVTIILGDGRIRDLVGQLEPALYVRATMARFFHHRERTGRRDRAMQQRGWTAVVPFSHTIHLTNPTFSYPSYPARDITRLPQKAMQPDTIPVVPRLNL
jgi:hypothetical protein